MKPELELKHLAPYLPYRLKYKYTAPGKTKASRKFDSINVLTIKDIDWALITQFNSIILRPLSDLTEEIEHNGEKFIPDHILYGFEWELGYLAHSGWVGFKRAEEVRNQLLEWHFDIFGLIKQGLAIDMNKV